CVVNPSGSISNPSRNTRTRLPPPPRVVIPAGAPKLPTRSTPSPGTRSRSWSNESEWYPSSSSGPNSRTLPPHPLRPPRGKSGNGRMARKESTAAVSTGRESDVVACGGTGTVTVSAATVSDGMTTGSCPRAVIGTVMASSKRTSQLQRVGPARRSGDRPVMSGDATEYPFHEEARRCARRSLRLVRELTVPVGRACNVDMHPRIITYKLAQEPGTRDGSRRSATGVLDVGVVGLDLLAIFVEHRQRP